MKPAADWLPELDEAVLSEDFHTDAEKLIARIQADAQAGVLRQLQTVIEQVRRENKVP